MPWVPQLVDRAAIRTRICEAKPRRVSFTLPALLLRGTAASTPVAMCLIDR